MTIKTNIWCAAGLLIAGGFGVAPPTASAAEDPRCPGTCSRWQQTMILWHCNNPGAGCGTDNCVCKDIAGYGFQDCYCLPPNVTRYDPGCGGGSGWRVIKRQNAKFVPGETVTFDLKDADTNFLELFDFHQIADDGQIMQSMLLESGSVTGALSVAISGDASAPFWTVAVTEFKVQISGAGLYGMPIDRSTVTLAPEAADVIGVYDVDQQLLTFADAIPATLCNELFPNGVDITIQPALQQADDDHWDMFVSARSWFDLGLERPVHTEAGYELEVYGVTPGELVYFGAGTRRGALALGCEDLVLDLADVVVLGAAFADDLGYATFTVPKLIGEPGDTIYIQAVEFGNCTRSNLARTTVE